METASLNYFTLLLTQRFDLREISPALHCSLRETLVGISDFSCHTEAPLGPDFLKIKTRVSSFFIAKKPPDSLGEQVSSF